MTEYRMSVQEQKVVCNFLLFQMELFGGSRKKAFTPSEVVAVLDLMGKDPEFFNDGIFDQVKEMSDYVEREGQ